MRQVIGIITLFWTIWAAGIAMAYCTGTDQINALSVEDKKTLNAIVDDMPYHDGLLWRATRDDLTLTLFGTYHVSHRKTSAHINTLQPMIAEADQVFLEMTPDDMKKLQSDMAKDPSLMFITSGPTLPDLLGDKDWERYSAQMEARQFPAVIASRFKPSWAGMMLGISPCEMASGALTEGGIDMLIGEYATTRNIPLHSLEDYHTALQLLDDMSQEEQLEMLRMLLDWPGDPDDMAFTLREAYIEQHPGIIWAYSELLAQKDGTTDDLAAFEERLLTRRNQSWVDLIDVEPDGQHIFIAFGALHLTGKNGVLNLLKSHGFTLTRLPFDA